MPIGLEELRKNGIELGVVEVCSTSITFDYGNHFLYSLRNFLGKYSTLFFTSQHCCIALQFYALDNGSALEAMNCSSSNPNLHVESLNTSCIKRMYRYKNLMFEKEKHVPSFEGVISLKEREKGTRLLKVVHIIQVCRNILMEWKIQRLQVCSIHVSVMILSIITLRNFKKKEEKIDTYE